MPGYTSFAAILPVLGLCALTMVTSANAMMQMTTSAMMRGRVAALYLMIFLGGTPLGAPLIGWVGEEFGARWMLIGGGAVSLLGITAGTLWYLHKQDIHRPELQTVARDMRWPGRPVRTTSLSGDSALGGDRGLELGELLAR